MVLGLTMAEVVLLILFTVLLVLATLLVRRKDEYDRLAAQLKLVEKEISETSSGAIRDPEEFFRELEIARQQASQADNLRQQLEEMTRQNVELSAALERERAARLAAERAPAAKGHQWPPIINLSEAEGYFFETGSAELSDDFKAALTDKVVPKILQIASDYPDVNVIEVIGHTDEQPIHRRYSNLDSSLIDVLRSGDVASLMPADNAGLGMSRAVAVVLQLRKDDRLRSLFPRILPMSGAQLIQVDQTLSQGSAGDVKQRRRIEIRLRKYESGGAESVTGGGASR